MNYFTHTKRECNTLTYGLARYAAGIPDFLVWMDDVPLQFHDILQVDLLDLFE